MHFPHDSLLIFVIIFEADLRGFGVLFGFLCSNTQVNEALTSDRLGGAWFK